MSSPLEEDVLSQPILDFYLFISHGNTISANHNYYPIKTEFRAVTLYSKPYESYIDTLGKLLKDYETSETQGICRFVYGSCPKVPIVDKESGEKFVYLPPVIFQPEKQDRPDLKKKLDYIISKFLKKGEIYEK